MLASAKRPARANGVDRRIRFVAFRDLSGQLRMRLWIAAPSLALIPGTEPRDAVMMLCRNAVPRSRLASKEGQRPSSAPGYQLVAKVVKVHGGHVAEVRELLAESLNGVQQPVYPLLDVLDQNSGRSFGHSVVKHRPHLLDFLIKVHRFLLRYSVAAVLGSPGDYSGHRQATQLSSENPASVTFRPLKVAT